MIVTVIKVVLLVILCLLIVLLCYPVRVSFHFVYGYGPVHFLAKLHPLFLIRKIGFTLFDTASKAEKEDEKRSAGKKEEAKSKKKKKEKKKKQKPEREWPPLSELLLGAVNLLGRFKKGLNRLHVRLLMYYGFPDPSLTGEITGALYDVLPQVTGNPRRLKWKFGLYPVWCTEKPCADIKGEITSNALMLLVAFGGALPGILRLLPKKKKQE